MERSFWLKEKLISSFYSLRSASKVAYPNMPIGRSSPKEETKFAIIGKQ